MKRILSVLLALMLLMSATALAEGTKLTVSGSGSVSVMADQAQIMLGVQESSTDVLIVQATVNQKINAIFEALIAAGVEKKNIGTESIYIFANYDYSEDVPRLTGYTASNTISVLTTDVDKIGAYIDAAFDAGANTLDSVDFSVRDTSEAKAEALQLAVQDAFEKANIIAEAAGMQIVEITQIDETADAYVSDMTAKYSNSRVEEAAADSSTLVQASSLQVQASIKIEFELSKGES